MREMPLGGAHIGHRADDVILELKRAAQRFRPSRIANFLPYRLVGHLEADDALSIDKSIGLRQVPPVRLGNSSAASGLIKITFAVFLRSAFRNGAMPWNQEPLKRLIRKVIGASPDSRTPDERFRDEALPHLPAVTRFALSLTRDESDAEDLVQETYLRAFRAWDQFVPGSECRAWLFTICRHTYFRTSHREQRVVAYEDAELEALGAAALHSAAQAEGLDDVFSRMEVMEAVRTAVDALPDPFREVVVLVDLEEQSYEDAARVLEIPKGTVRSRLFRGRRLLQERLIEHARDAGLVRQQRPGVTREETSNDD